MLFLIEPTMVLRDQNALSRSIIKVIYLCFMLIICIEIIISEDKYVGASDEIKSLQHLSVKRANFEESLAIQERIECKIAIEEIYWNHRIWPNHNRYSKPALQSVVSKEKFLRKIQDDI